MGSSFGEVLIVIKTIFAGLFAAAALFFGAQPAKAVAEPISAFG
jgi:hypothetical protein